MNPLYKILKETSPTDACIPTGQVVVSQLNSAKDSDVLDILLRESVQNSHDAAEVGKTPDYYFNAYSFSRQSELISCFDVSSEEGYRLLKDISKTTTLLEIADRNTTGLRGPYWQTDANNNEIRSKYKNYLSLVYAFGQFDAKDSNSGGTNGVGKACYFMASQFQTVAFYTKIQVDYDEYPHDETRLIFVRIPSVTNTKPKFYYGCGQRNNLTRDWKPQPLLNENADAMAELLGLTRFSDGEYGTSVLIFNPQFDDSYSNSIDYLRTILSEKVCYWFWPILSKASINIHLSIEGEEVDYGSLFEGDFYSRLNMCFQRWQISKDRGTYGTAYPVRIEKCNNTIAGYIFENDFSYINKDEIPVLFRKSGHSGFIATMRDVDFIVEYKWFDATQKDVFHIGLFHTAPNTYIGDSGFTVDEVLRLSENQTHDKWSVNSQIKTTELKTFIRSLSKLLESYISERVSDDEDTPVFQAGSGISRSLARFLNFGFAPSLPGEPQHKKRKPRRKPSTTTPPGNEKRMSLDRVHDMEFYKDTLFNYIVIPYVRTNKSPEKLKITLKVSLDGGGSEELSTMAGIKKLEFAENYEGRRREIDYVEKGLYRVSSPGLYFLTIWTKGPLAIDVQIKKVM